MIDWLEEILKEGEPAVVIPGGVVGRLTQPRGESPMEVPAAGSGSGAETLPLSVLYRRMGESTAAPAAAIPARRSPEAEEREVSRPGLTVRELDLAVRRDSRRYDGGMSIY